MKNNLLNSFQVLSAWAEAEGRRAWLFGGCAFLLAAALMALVTSVVYGHDTKVANNLRATMLVTVTYVDGSTYYYRYFNDTCSGSGIRSPTPAVGTQVRIVYNPNNKCDSVDYDPAARKQSDLTWLLVFSAAFSLVVGSAGWDAARQR